MKRVLSDDNLRQFFEIINQSVTIETDIPMEDKTTFHCGGKADYFLLPRSPQQLILIKRAATIAKVPLLIVGRGANLLVSDSGIREPVVSTAHLTNLDIDTFHSGSSEVLIQADAGTTIEDCCNFAKDNRLAGLTFLAGLPASVGGAVTMNARCYEQSISEVLHSVNYIDENGDIHSLIPQAGDFSYKDSPFQHHDWVLLSAKFKTVPGDLSSIEAEMEEHIADRERKGHYRYPCAGSIFKNNHQFGLPSGTLIEQLGFKGYRVGDAQVSDFHANIIVNLGQARSSDINQIIQTIQDKAQSELHLHLETEIQKVGDWD